MIHRGTACKHPLPSLLAVRIPARIRWFQSILVRCLESVNTQSSWALASRTLQAAPLDQTVARVWAGGASTMQHRPMRVVATHRMTEWCARSHFDKTAALTEVIC